MLGEICACQRTLGLRNPPGTPNPAQAGEGAWGAPGTRLPAGWESRVPPGVAVRQEQAAGVTAGPVLIWLFHLGWGWVQWGMGRGGRDGDTLYTGNMCLMRDTRLAPQAGTAPGLLKHGG